MALAPGWQKVEGAMNEKSSGNWEQFEDGCFNKMLNQLKDVIYVQK